MQHRLAAANSVLNHYVTETNPLPDTTPKGVGGTAAKVADIDSACTRTVASSAAPAS
jgi:hypothetical protein